MIRKGAPHAGNGLFAMTANRENICTWYRASVRLPGRYRPRVDVEKSRRRRRRPAEHGHCLQLGRSLLPVR